MTSAFALDDPVESVDYDRVKSRLAVSSHHGKIKMYDVDKNGKLAPYMLPVKCKCFAGVLTLIWEKSMTAPAVGAHCAIPRSIRFTVKGEQLLVFGLESGIMCV